MLNYETISRVGFPVLLPGLLIAFLALALMPRTASAEENAGKDRQVREAGKNMAQAQAAGRTVRKPLMDMTLPAKFETATFALG